MSNAKTVMSQAANTWAGPTYIEDVFSTYLYTGTNATQSIVNGIDLAGEGGLVWQKLRTHPTPPDTQDHYLRDTERGGGYRLYSNLTNAQFGDDGGISSFNSDGFTLGSATAGNLNGATYASWTFRKAPRFFDCFTFTGDGVNGRVLNHNLGVEPGMVVVKSTSLSGADTGTWRTYHRGYGFGGGLSLERTDSAGYTFASPITAATDTTITLNNPASYGNINSNGATYVAYLFAHDPLGPSGDGSDGLIACGSYTTSSNLATVEIGWEPQWILTKKTSAGSDWLVFDNMRGLVVGTGDQALKPNASDAEGVNNVVDPTSTGFKAYHSDGNYVYIAIRRGPMRQPASGTEVFAVDRADANGSATNPEFVAGFPVDHAILKGTGGSGSYFSTRLIAPGWGDATTTAAYTTTGSQTFDFQNGWYENSLNNTFYSWMFRRAPGFFDVVAYTGDGVAGRTVSHNLGVVPDLIIAKSRTVSSTYWRTLVCGVGLDQVFNLNTSGAKLSSGNGSYFFGDGTLSGDATQPTNSEFYVANEVNQSGAGIIAYLFATLPGVSKVGSYTGNGTSQTIDCGFTTGARFVLIKRTDTTGNWKVMDTARGIVAAGDPYLELNNTNAEFTGVDVIDPDASGFSLPNGWPDFNASGGTYIYLAIA